jgi:serine/threonine protein kinase
MMGGTGCAVIREDMAQSESYRNALPLPSMLLEYRLDAILGAGGFGMTYLGWDTNLQKKVAIKEYLPVELAVRALDGSIVPINTSSEYNYQWGLDRFLQEARLLARFTHANIVQVARYFGANGTAYMVMRYEEGKSLSQYLTQNPMPEEAVLKGFLLPLLDGLHAVHEAGFLHRDIKPSNIFIRDNGGPLLIDFGAARLAMGGATHTMTSVLTPGYAPLEQYSKEGNQGPWTDVYSLAGVMFRGVTGEHPPDAVQRLSSDTVMAALVAARPRYDVAFLGAINRGMEVDEKRRPQTALQWKAMILGDRTVVSAPASAGADGHVSAPMAADQGIEETVLLRRPDSNKPSLSQLTWFAAGALVLFLVIGGVQIVQKPVPAPLAAKGQPASGTGAGLRDVAVREFAALDKHGNGFLTREEIAGDPALAADFDKVDSRRDGRVTLDEYVSYRCADKC